MKRVAIERITDAHEFDVSILMGGGEDMTVHLIELASQPYADCKFSAGAVMGAGPDTVYLRMERSESPPDEASTWLLRPDELAALLWVDQVGSRRLY